MICLCLGLSTGSVHALPSSLDHKVEAFLTKEWKNSGSPGMSAAIVRNGKLEYAEGFGLVDVQNQVPATPESVYRLGSVTKQFTSMMIMQLVQEGKLQLDQKAKSILPDQIPDAWSEVTVRQLLNHTAGIPNYTANLAFLAMVRRSVVHDRILDSVRTKPLDFKPGTKWSYSNSGYILLGLILEKVDGRTYEQNLQSRILDPLGMRETYFVSETSVVPHRATGYSHRSKKLMISPYIDMAWPFAAGSMESTVRDLAKWDAALYTDKLLKPELRDQMWTSTKLADGTNQPYGFGWATRPINGIPVYEHSGGIPGFTSAIRRAPSVGLTTIVLLNTDDSEAMLVADRLMKLMEPRLLEVVKSIVDSDASTTALIRRAFESVVAGKPDRALFSNEMNKLFTPEFLTGMAKQAADWGPLKSFDLIKSEDLDGARTRVYHVVFARASVKAEFTVGKSGLIEGAVLHPE